MTVLCYIFPVMNQAMKITNWLLRYK